MPSRIEELIAKSLFEHHAVVENEFGTFLNCSCGWNVDTKSPKVYEWQFRIHQSEKIFDRAYCEEVVPLVDALKNHIIALDDWLNIHASDFCSEERVREALTRIGEKGTISYIAKLQRAAREALHRFDAPAGTPAAKDESNGNLPRD